MDIISKLPPGIIETILCLLPIQDAARTSILSREWRYHWTKIPKLAFIERTFRVSTNRAELPVLEQRFSSPWKRKKMDKRRKLFYAIYQILLTYQGPIHEFTLSMEVDDSCVEINHIILHLAKRNTVKILQLDLVGRYVLPLSFGSLHQLTNLSLKNCSFERLPSFAGFGCLTTLCLQNTFMRVKTLMCVLAGCPLLKRLTLDSDSVRISSDNEGFNIVDLFKCLPVIEYLYVPCDIVRCFVPERLPKELPITLIHLKCLCIHFVCVSHKHELPFLALLVNSSPNLEKLQLYMYDEYNLETYEFTSSTLDEYLDFTLEHLNELELLNFSETEDELDFVKLILAKSPVLKKVRIFPYPHSDEEAESELQEYIPKVLLRSPCASPSVNIVVG